MYFPQHSDAFKALLEGSRGRPVAVLGHMRPDGDCIGSQVGLTRMLRALGVDAVAVNHDAVPRVLADFVGDTPWVRAAQYAPAPGTVAACVDCADHVRIGPRLRELFPRPWLMVDHHVSNEGFAEHDFVLPDAAATAEVLAGLFFDAGWKPDPVAAQALYVGIASDTGQFRFPSTTTRVFSLCSGLMAAGADPGAAARLLYERESFGKMRLLRRFLDSLKLEFGGRVCVGMLRDSDYEQSGATREDSEGLVDYARSIDGVDIGVLLEERQGAIKGSLRAKVARYGMHRLAQQFDGGGHACAAGFNLRTTLEEFYPRFLAAAAEQLKTADAGEIK
ncbi:MAG: bifunctional oligoribonuclease/PAP phosphatase NrnA [Opitutales bacterium]|jgi:phosphoesterase RecJ-like protein